MLRCSEKRMLFLLVVTILMLVSVSGGAYAYIDPGTGSYLIQMAAAGILASLFVIKGFWRNIKESVTRLVAKRRKQ